MPSFIKGFSKEEGLNQNLQNNQQPNNSSLLDDHLQQHEVNHHPPQYIQDEINKFITQLEEVLQQPPSGEEDTEDIRNYFRNVIEEFFSKPVNYPYISDRSKIAINSAKLIVIKYRETKQEYHEEKKRADEMVKNLQIAEQEKREFQFEKEKLQYEKREMQIQCELDKKQRELDKMQCELEKLKYELEKVNSEKNERRIQFEKLKSELEKVNLEKQYLESSITNSHTNEQILNKLLGMEQSKVQVSVPTITPITFKEILKEKGMQRYVYGNLKHVLSMSEREELRPHRMTGEFNSIEEMIETAGQTSSSSSPTIDNKRKNKGEINSKSKKKK